MNKAKSARRMGGLVLAAVLLLATLAGVGFATGAIQSVFEGMIGRYDGEPSTDYEALAQLSQGDPGDFVMTFSDGAVVTLNCAQSYYDGSQLFIGLKWNVAYMPADLDYAPGGENFELLAPIDGVFQPRPTQPAGNYMTGAHSWIAEWMSAEEYAAFIDKLETQGSSGVVFNQYYLSDGIYSGENHIDPSTDDSGVYEDGTRWRFIEFETPLADEFTNRDSLPIRVRVYAQRVYYYVDKTGMYRYTNSREREIHSAEVEIFKAQADLRTYTASTEREKYSSDFELIVSPVNARLIITTVPCAEWLEAGLRWSDSADYPFYWNLYVGGADLGSSWTLTSSVTGASGSFVLPEGAREVMLRPVYIISGEHADEQVVISLDTPES